jgi:hypothetical protein
MEGFGFQSSGGSSTPSGGIISKTFAEITALIASSGLVAGSFYKITDRGDRWLLFQAVSTNQLATDGQRLMLCAADYAIETDSYGNNWIGVWNDTKSVVADDLTIWGGLAWKNLTGAIGTAVDDVTLDAVNWVVVPKASFTNNEYIEMQFGVQYDWTNDFAVKQWDNKNNVFVYSLDWGDSYNNCDISDWNFATSGNALFSNHCRGIYNNSNNGNIDNNSNNGGIYDNSNFGDIDNNSNTGNIDNNSNTGNIDNNSNNGNIDNNSNNGGIYDNSNNGGIYSNSNVGSISDNSNNGGIYSNSNVGSISANSNNGGIYDNSNFGDIYNNSNNGEIYNNSNNGHILNNSNNGHILSTSSTLGCSVQNNINNGYITGAQVADVSDPIVNKS